MPHQLQLTVAILIIAVTATLSHVSADDFPPAAQGLKPHMVNPQNKFVD